MLRLTDNPISRYPKDRPLDEDLGRWTVAHVKSRQEKAFAADLINGDISYYLPLIENRTRRRDNGKIRKSLLPLFPGYVAMALDQNTKGRVYATNRVVSIVSVADQRQFVDELLQVQRAIDGNMKVALQPSFTVGQPVRVKSGPMMGLRGEVSHSARETIFVVRIHIFQRAVRVELDEADLEAL
jgi:transcription antitermination factor NusG